MLLGLSTIEAKNRLRAEGYNILPEAEAYSFMRLLLSTLKEPMFLLLLSAAAIYFAIGDLSDAVMISIFALISLNIALFQEWKSEKALEKLKDLSSPRALVIRDGIQQRISGIEVVRGDVICVSEGDRIPADAQLLSDTMLLIDESLLTGESIPVEKINTANADLYSGTLILRGHGQAVVTKTGTFSQIGKIGIDLKDIKIAPSQLRREIGRLIKFFATLAGSLSVICIAIYGIMRGSWLEGFLNGIALSMSLLPEEFPLILIVFMAMGAWRISKVNVLTRKAASIEALGAATVLCTDKTGTLTENKMDICCLITANESWRGRDIREIQSKKLLEMLEAGNWASHNESLDPIDKAFKVINQSSKSLVQWYDTTPQLPMAAGIYKDESGGLEIFAKGAPETIWKICGLTNEKIDFWNGQLARLAEKGLRLLAVAKATAKTSDIPVTPDIFNYEFLGLVGFADPLRKEVPDAILKCQTAGIRVIMITGDYPVTAQAIATQAGWINPRVITGKDLEELDEVRFTDIIKTVDIFARIKPDQKLRIVRGLKANGEIVAMTGDGVNDAPSIKAADIGVSMGGRGTDVAREASSIILLDNSFASLVATISLGRRIYDNIKKAMVYICAIHVPITGLVIIPLLLDLPAILTPLLIALIEMIIDPVCSVVLEAEEAEENIMKRPPRNPDKPILPLSLIGWGILQGIISIILLTGVIYMAHGDKWAEGEIRTEVMLSIFAINIALILVNRSYSPSLSTTIKRHNPYLVWILLGTSFAFFIIFTSKKATDIFKVSVANIYDVILALIVGILLFLVLETIKYSHDIMKKIDR